jgi:AraC-like DNA-binding protein
LIGVSNSHLCRAFKDSLQVSPHAYVIRRRLERAKELMLDTGASLSQIAGDCGLYDQAHFTKLFTRIVGKSPGVWRRARVPSSR